MNSAVEPLLKSINDLKDSIYGLEQRICLLDQEIYRLKHSIPRAGSSIWTSEYTSSYSSSNDSTASVQHISPNTDGTLTVTYSDGTTQTISPVL